MNIVINRTTKTEVVMSRTKSTNSLTALYNFKNHDIFLTLYLKHLTNTTQFNIKAPNISGPCVVEHVEHVRNFPYMLEKQY